MNNDDVSVLIECSEILTEFKNGDTVDYNRVVHTINDLNMIIDRISSGNNAVGNLDKNIYAHGLTVYDPLDMILPKPSVEPLKTA